MADTMVSFFEDGWISLKRIKKIWYVSAGKINVQHPQQALITRENKCRGRRISKNVKEIAAGTLSFFKKRQSIW